MKFYGFSSNYGCLPTDAEYPCIGLWRDRWDDFTYRTKFNLKYYSKPGVVDFVEEVKILHKPDKVTAIPSSFEQLDGTYCSLGQTIEYYEKLFDLGAELYRDVLIALNDVVYNRDIALALEDEEGLKVSLLREADESDIPIPSRPVFAIVRDPIQEAKPKRRESVYEWDIEKKQAALSTHRRMLRILLTQKKTLGGQNPPPHLETDIQERREDIKLVKQILQQWGVEVEPHLNDEQPDQPVEAVQPSTRNTVFISYSHADKRWMDRLMVHLKPLVRDENFKVWNDTMIDPGANWRAEIDKALKATKVALLLVSADFLASDFIAHNELPPLLKAAQEEGAVIMPLIIGHCRFTHYPDLSQFQAINSPSQPLADMPRARREAFLVKLTEAVEKAL